jgi:hypothetical protein
MMLDVGAGYLPEFVRNEVLPSLPRRSGEGIHRGLYDLARVLTPWRTAAQREAILRCYAALCDRHVPETEIQAALRDGARRAWKPNGTDGVALRDPRDPAMPRPGGFTLEAFKDFVAGGPRVDERWLAERSTLPVEGQTPFTFLQAISAQDEQVLLFDDVRTQGLLWTHPRGAQAHDGPPHSLHLNRLIRGRPCGVWFLTNPVDATLRINGFGRLSRRSTGNITAWRYMVVECDRADISEGEWLTALVLLRLPIVSIVSSGDRLAHALVHIGAGSNEEWNARRNELLPDLVRIGADVSSLSAVQLTRLPCCERLGRQDAAGAYQKFQDRPRMQRLCS